MSVKAVIDVPRPDAEGQFASPLDGAKFMVSLGIPQTPLRGKIPFLPAWEQNASLDFAQLEEWAAKYPGCNFGSVAYARQSGFCVFEVDSTDVRQKYQAETGTDFAKTFITGSRQGGHRWYVHTPETIAIGNIAQDADSKFSFRANNQQCVSPGSIHPDTGKQYYIAVNVAPVQMPAQQVEWLKAQRKSKSKPQPVPDDGQPILKGGRNAALASIAGKWRHDGLDPQAIEMGLLKKNEERCVPPLPESEVKTIAASIGRYPEGKDSSVLVRGRSAGEPLTPQESEEREAEIRAEMSQAETVPYPHFPRWTLAGCSMFEGFARPLSDHNMRLPEFMFLPAMAMLLNYVGLRVKISGIGNTLPNIFLVLIGKRGEVIKSSCVRDAVRYLKNIGILADANAALLSSQVEQRSLIWTVGSPEGFGIEMNRLGCHNGILFYDELKTLANKVKIENSNLTGALLSLYESEKYQNTVKDRKGCFSLEAETYCASLIACCTDKNFLEEWGKMQAGSTGLEDRFFFLLQPEKLKPKSVYTHVDTESGARETRKLIEKAIAQGTYRITDRSALDAKFKSGGMTNRQQLRAQKWALGFAIDLGKDEIDADCIERGIAISVYEKQVKQYLRPFEAETRDGAIQMQMINHLQQSGNRLELRELQKRMNWLRFGSDIWRKSYHGLLSSRVIRETGDGRKGNPKVVELIQFIARADED